MYLWIKSFHIIAVISWMAGMLYLPRLYVYHAGIAVGSEASEMLKVMERREANGSSPDVAAATITRALTARRPRAVYLSGKDSRRLAILSGLPAPVLDMARRRVFRLPAPGSLAS